MSCHFVTDAVVGCGDVAAVVWFTVVDRDVCVDTVNVAGVCCVGGSVTYGEDGGDGVDVCYEGCCSCMLVY